MTNQEPNAGVIGWPIGHSKSPLIHGHWLEQHQIAGTYRPISLAPDGAGTFFRQFKDQGLIGANVTLPHKPLAFKYADEIEETARPLSSVNTLWIENDKIWATSTDGYGFIANLDETFENWSKNPDRAIILGAGGAAPPIIQALTARGYECILANRTYSKAEIVAQKFGPFCHPARWDDLPKILHGARLLVNTTSLGMSGQPRLTIDIADLASDALVADIIYTPLETELLQAAKNRGLRSINGLGMLLHQAVPGFEKWFGIRPQVTEVLRNKLITELNI